MSGYKEIASYFEKAFQDIDPPGAFAGAIRAMRTEPELCEQIDVFDETLWCIIESF